MTSASERVPTIAVVVSGLDYTHPDLYLKVWLDNREIPGALRSALVDSDGDGLITFRDLNSSANAALVYDSNTNGWIDAGDLLCDPRWADGSDTDGNGYTDDLFGWDFVNGDNDPFDDRGHGTHVTGIIAAADNGVGITGIAPNVRIIPLKFIAANGVGLTSAVVKALDYYTEAAKAAVPGEAFVATNNSWASGGYSDAVADAIARGAAQNILLIAAAGNDGSDTDFRPAFPSTYSTEASGYDAVISVAALGGDRRLASFSDYGATTVDLAIC